MSKNNKPWPCMECRVMMALVDEDHCKCPVCGTEVWFEFSVQDNSEIAKLMREKYKSNLPPKDPIPAGEAAKGGGGSKSKGRDRKGLMQKKSLSQINAGLNGKCQNFDA